MDQPFLGAVEIQHVVDREQDERGEVERGRVRLRCVCLNRIQYGGNDRQQCLEDFPCEACFGVATLL